MKKDFTKFIDTLQLNIKKQIEFLDPSSKFKIDKWKRDDGGGGLTMAIKNGDVFEKGGVNISKVFGVLPDSIYKTLNVEPSEFYACGISLILHPKNPMVPTFHANLRYFELYENGKVTDKWFGGGVDLTPYYIFENDISMFHQYLKTICDNFDPNCYQKFKRNCDEYFWNKHRKEARGVGGLFFDYCRETNENNIESWFEFMVDLGNKLMDPYTNIVKKRKNMSFTKNNLEWQQIRRGRYVEFNLIHDKGTVFGLKTNGRIESILVSMPPQAKWAYSWIPKKHSEEEKLLKILKKPINWL